MTGWIKLYRRLLGHRFWPTRRPYTKLEAWVDILMRTNHQEERVLMGMKPITVEAGQLLTSQVALSERWRWNRKRTHRFLEMCVALQMCTIETDRGRDRGYTLITVCNWQTYQGGNGEVGTSSGALSGAFEGHLRDFKGTLLKNGKNVKEGREGEGAPSDTDPGPDMGGTERVGAGHLANLWQAYIVKNNLSSIGSERAAREFRVALATGVTSDEIQGAIMAASMEKRRVMPWEICDELVKAAEGRAERAERSDEDDKVYRLKRERAAREHQRQEEEAAGRAAKHEAFEGTLGAFKALPRDRQAEILLACPETRFAQFGTPLWVAQHAEKFGALVRHSPACGTTAEGKGKT